MNEYNAFGWPLKPSVSELPLNLSVAMMVYDGDSLERGPLNVTRWCHGRSNICSTIYISHVYWLV